MLCAMFLGLWRWRSESCMLRNDRNTWRGTTQNWWVRCMARQATRADRRHHWNVCSTNIIVAAEKLSTDVGKIGKGLANAREMHLLSLEMAITLLLTLA